MFARLNTTSLTTAIAAGPLPNVRGSETLPGHDRREEVAKRLLTLCFISLALPLCAQEALDTKIRERIAKGPGKVSLFAKNLDTGATYGLGADDRVRTASTIKLPIAVEVHGAVAEGKAKWTDTVEMQAGDVVGGSGVLFEFSRGLRFPVRDLTHLMIVVSDNTATNLLLDRFTADAVNTRLKAMGFEHTRSLRKILGDGKNLKPVASGHSKEGLQEEYKRFGIGVSTPREMVRLLEMLDKGEAVNKEVSAAIIGILKRQQHKDGIGRTIREWPVASKSGALDRLRSDVGIVYSPRGRIAMALTVEDIPEVNYTASNPGLTFISDLAILLLDGLGSSANPR
jgi:beta-lactamase class A